MKTVTSKLYEGMFLVDSALAASDWQGVNEAIKAILDRVGAEVVSMKKWDERKLAYDIKTTTRGTYILVFFRVEGPRIAEIERMAKLSEQIIRVMILCEENFDVETVNDDTPAVAAEKRAARAAEKAEQAEAEVTAEENIEPAAEEPVEQEVSAAEEAVEAEKQQ